jgi:GrpB-like predicted nucleotidyltransferase (UPF0157 family)/protein-S-isoprenylcysteine O-methyltransferase Ste14
MKDSSEPPLLRSVTVTSLFTLVVALLLPLLLHHAFGHVLQVDLGPFRYSGLLPLLPGAALALWCVRDFLTSGRGTPAPFDPPGKLVISGPYRYVRNPMYIGLLLVLLGESVLMSSLPVLLYALVVWVVAHLFIVFWEEPRLMKKFGAEYREYLRTVRRWLPGEPEAGKGSTGGQRLIVVVEYDPGWPLEYRREETAIANALGEELARAHHIGSTAVPGLRAKPIIDILLEVRNVETLDGYDEAMKGLGYMPRGEYGIPGRRFYIKGLHNRTHHVHAFDEGTDNVARHLAFRDYLIAHPEVASEYGELKARCARECGNDSGRYCDCKDEFVRMHEQRALVWISKSKKEK